MTGEAAATAVSKDQKSNTTKMLKAKDIVTSKIALTDLSEPYLFVYDDDVTLLNNAEEDHLAKAVNIILAKKMGYRVVTPCYMGIITDHIVCMVK